MTGILLTIINFRAAKYEHEYLLKKNLGKKNLIDNRKIKNSIFIKLIINN